MRRQQNFVRMLQEQLEERAIREYLLNTTHDGRVRTWHRYMDPWASTFNSSRNCCWEGELKHNGVALASQDFTALKASKSDDFAIIGCGEQLRVKAFAV